MTTSSQTPPGALPPEAPYPAVRPLHQAVFETFGLAVPAPAGPATDTTPAATVTEAAAAVLDARIAQDGGATAEQLAEAEQNAGILFDPARVKAVADAARAQGYAEAAADLEGVRAELQDARRELALQAGDHRRLQAVMRLCEGHRGEDLVMVATIATAAESGSTGLDGIPMLLTWDRSTDIPAAANPDKRVIVHCRSSYGGRAELVLDSNDRQALASVIGAEPAGDIHATCTTAGCGSDAEDLDDTDMWGWSRLDVVGTDDRPRWYCSPACVSNALARADEELAAADQLAATDPDEQVPYLPADDDAPEYLTQDQAVHGER
ncbi:hypothetical protein ABTZ58_06880 [Streptomyces sp. NPDC094143]|uniref:hypothetical protein n=1 Tax=Streptomyces sp. NPDC094143 TaxID=3155310 RepID=UPI00331CE13D